MAYDIRKPPWVLNQFIRVPMHVPQIHLQLQQIGWIEKDHVEIEKVKNKIAHMESAEEWELRKKITNPYEAIFSGDDVCFPSIAKVQPLSRSYFKMIEMLDLIDFWNEVSKEVPFVSAHICEGPGGFIQATIEGIKRHSIPIKNIYAMTLKPTKSHIPGWRRSIHFLKKHYQIQLLYGSDDTGNILKQKNQKSFCDSVNQLAQLFTADGGFDFSVDYTNQEKMAFSLLLASFSIGLSSLAKGGTMIIKLFDIYSQATQDLFLGSAVFFDSFTLYKPATSRPCNSERYFIAKGFNGGAEKWCKHLQLAQIKHEQSPLTRLLDYSWPPPIQAAVDEQIQWQELLQITSIEDTLNLDKDTIYTRVLKNIRLSKEWCRVFHIPMV